jgi:hypothetical protein
MNFGTATARLAMRPHFRFVIGRFADDFSGTESKTNGEGQLRGHSGGRFRANGEGKERVYEERRAGS